jgi:hypothetical protein
MLLALLVLALVAAVLAGPMLGRAVARLRAKLAGRGRGDSPPQDHPYDPGRERRAEHRARELLRSCVNHEEWAMYRDLGFIRVAGRRGTEGRRGTDPRRPPYAYLIYPHKPIVSYVPASGRLLSEYCVDFPDLGFNGPRGRLPASDDVLAKWMALTGDERRLVQTANMHLPGRQVDPRQIRRDLWRLSQWERERIRRTQRPEGSVPAP